MNIQNPLTADQPEIDTLHYLNTHFMPQHYDAEYMKLHRASGLAYDVNALIDTARFALENETSGIPLDRRGIANTLEITSRIASDLIVACEMLENPKQEAGEEVDHTAVRLAQFAEWTGTEAPESLLDGDGAPTDELLDFCKSQGLSLDWLFLGDAKGLVMAQHRNTARKNSTQEEA